MRVLEAASKERQRIAEVTGEVRARVQTDLAFRTAGKIVERLVDVGSHVQNGDVIARIDDTQQRADVVSAEANLLSAQATLRQKELAYRRYEALVETSTVAQQTLDQATEDLAVARGTSESAEASLAIAREELSHTELKAEANGTITARNIEVGQVVSAAQPSFTLAHDGPRDAVFDVFEAFFLTVQTSDQAVVTPVSDPRSSLTTAIREIAPVIDTTTGTIRVKAALPENVQWPLGAPVVGRFAAPPLVAIALPWSAMTSFEGKPAVWVVDMASRTVALRPIIVSDYRTGDFSVASGVSPGELVVTEGGKFLRPEQAVTWKEN
ncbi:MULTISPECIES: efflux RND transporter periplasmic adaptor subunit [Agrobacterium]|uniref:efflux RND transporter periplasmic adaptor subunit n=1 Tax=Agrobacterium sp. MS2 TaxID=1345498 RepID=UPI00312C8971